MADQDFIDERFGKQAWCMVRAMDIHPHSSVGGLGGASASPSASALPAAGRASFGQATASAMSMRWSALHDAAAAVASLAGIEAEPMTAQVRNFPAIMRDAGGSRRELAEQGIDDLTAIMEPGLSALLAVHARGADAAHAAAALWEEFRRSRDALLALMPQQDNPPRRSA